MHDDTQLANRRRELERQQKRHADMVDGGVDWFSSLLKLIIYILVAYYDVFEWVFTRSRQYFYAPFYDERVKGIEKFTVQQCKDLQVWREKEVTVVDRLTSAIKTYMRRHHYSIDQMSDLTEILTRFTERHPRFDQMPRGFATYADYFLRRHQYSLRLIHARFQHLTRFFFAHARIIREQDMPPWSDFFQKMVDKALSGTPGPFSSGDLAMVAPTNFLAATQQSSNMMALANFSCQFLPFVPDVKHPHPGIQFDYIKFNGPPSVWWGWIESMMSVVILLLLLQIVNMIYRRICCRNRANGYYYLDADYLLTRREIECAIVARMRACDEVVAPSRLISLIESAFSVGWLYANINDFSSMTLRVKLLSMALCGYGAYMLYSSLKNVCCNRYRYFGNQEDFEHSLQNLFVSFGQEVRLVNGNGYRQLEITPCSYSVIDQEAMHDVVTAILTRLKIDYKLVSNGIHINDIRQISVACLRHLNILIFSNIDGYFIGRLIENQLRRVLSRAHIECNIQNGAFDCCMIRLGAITLQKLQSRILHLDLEVEEVQHRGSTAVTIKVEHILSQAQLALLDTIRKVWLQHYASGAPDSSVMRVPQRRKRKGKRRKRHVLPQQAQRVVQPAVPEMRITWPCGLSWSTSVTQAQVVVPVRADIPIFLVLCGAEDSLPQGIFEMFSLIVLNGPAIVRAQGANGVIRVKPNDEAKTHHGREWKLKHVGTNWRIAAREERPEEGRGHLLICDTAYQKGSPRSRVVLAMPPQQSVPRP